MRRGTTGYIVVETSSGSFFNNTIVQLYGVSGVRIAGTIVPKKECEMCIITITATSRYNCTYAYAKTRSWLGNLPLVLVVGV